MLISFSLLLSQETYTFTTCGQEGRYGPSQDECDMEYADDNLSGMVTVPSDSGIQYWEVPSHGIYTIEVLGASGGMTTYPNPDHYSGGGASMRGDFELSKGHSIKILVGQSGNSTSYCSAGGGGSFVVTIDNEPLIIAGGGGGIYYSHYESDYYQYGNSGTAGNPSYNGVNGGIDGYGGGSSEDYPSCGGGGFFGDGQPSIYTSYTCTPGLSFLNGGIGGQYSTNSNNYGGFGGGASYDYINWGGSAGGGGGYSGGGASQYTAGGGGSFNSGDNQYNINGEKNEEYIIYASSHSASSKYDFS